MLAFFQWSLPARDASAAAIDIPPALALVAAAWTDDSARPALTLGPRAASFRPFLAHRQESSRWFTPKNIVLIPFAFNFIYTLFITFLLCSPRCWHGRKDIVMTASPPATNTTSPQEDDRTKRNVACINCRNSKVCFETVNIHMMIQIDATAGPM